MYMQIIRQMSSLTSIQIQALVREMDTSLRRHKGLKLTNKILWRKKVEEENPRLYNDLPSVFEMHMDGKLDETFFFMLGLRHKIEKGEMTEDEASKIVGEKLFNRYVAPKIDTTVTEERAMSYEEYYKQFETNASNGEESSSS